MKLETFEQWKTKIRKGALNNVKSVSEYRYGDVIDYVSEHIDLDNDFDTIIAMACFNAYGTSIEEEYQVTHNTDELYILVAKELIKVMECEIQKGVY